MKKIFKFVLIISVCIAVALPFIRNAENKSLTAEIRKDLPGSFIQLSQGVTHFQQANSHAGKTVVLIHGFSVPYYIWDPTFEMLKANGYHVIRYDLLGRGYSDRPEVDYTQELFDKQLVDLLDELNITKAVDIIGLSMGGAITAKFVSDHPSRVNKVIFIDPSHELFYSKYLSVPFLGEYMAAVYLLPKAANSQMGDFRDPSKFASWPDKYRDQMQYKGFRNAILSTLRHFMNNDKLYLYQKVGELNKQTMLIWGKNDQTLPLAKSPRVAKALKVKTVIIPKTGHIPHFEKPQVVNPYILDFLQSKPEE